MHPDDLKFPVAFNKGTIYFFQRSEEWSSSYFGGPLDLDISGIEHGPRRLHRVATLSARDLPIGSSSLPLVYGMTYSGCTLRYRYEKYGRLELLELAPTSSSE